VLVPRGTKDVTEKAVILVLWTVTAVIIVLIGWFVWGLIHAILAAL